MNKGQRHGDSEDFSVDKNNPQGHLTEEHIQQQKNMFTTCQDCGLSWKNGHTCKAVGKTCLKCSQVGHFARVCRFAGEEDVLKRNDGKKPSPNAPRKIKRARRSNQSNQSDSKENRNDSNFTKPKEEANNNKQGFKVKQSEQKDGQKTCSKEELALKEAANALYKQGKFKLALAKYTKLIELSPTDANHYSNRSACYMMMEQYKDAITDAKKSIELNPTHIKAHTRLLKCALSLGNVVEAEAALSKLSEIDPKNEILAPQLKKLKEVQKHLEKETEAVASKQYNKALCEINRCLVTSNLSIPFKLRKGEYLALLGKYKEAEKVANDVLLEEPSNIDAKYILGLCIYQSDVDRAVEYFKQTLRLVPDHKKMVQLYKKAKKLAEKKKAGNDAVKNGDYSAGLKFYQEAMAVDPKNLGMKKKLHHNMSLAYHKLANPRKAIEECSKALEIDPLYVKALMRRGRCYMDLKNWEEAVKDLTRVCKLDDGKDCKKLLDEARQKLAAARAAARAAANKKDYHKVIGVARSASYEEIRKAYKQKALLHHPDRHAGATDEEQKKHEKEFKEITQAYRILMKGHKESNQGGCGCHGGRFKFGDDSDDDDDGGWAAAFHHFAEFMRERHGMPFFPY